MKAILRGDVDRLAVVDVETTGFGNADRIVEVAVVTMSPDGRVVDEWDTLINPERDVGPTHIHRVSASMVSAAPTFPEISVALGERLDGAALVAHNLPFDSRMLVNDYDRAGGLLDPGAGLCTYRMSGETLAGACDRHSIPLDGHHRALADARATAKLLASLIHGQQHGEILPASVEMPAIGFIPRTLRRDAVEGPGHEMPYLERLSHHARIADEGGAALMYMEFLDWVLADLTITDQERTDLDALAGELGLSSHEVVAIRRRYLDSLVAASLRDGRIDDGERLLLERATSALGADPSLVSDRLGQHFATASEFVLEPGTRVCFTGSATGPDGSKIERPALEAQARDMGLMSVKNVSKKGCDLVVAADPMSQSGKARKARDLGIAIASVEHFLGTDPGAAIVVM